MGGACRGRRQRIKIWYTVGKRHWSWVRRYFVFWCRTHPQHRLIGYGVWKSKSTQLRFGVKINGCVSSKFESLTATFAVACFVFCQYNSHDRVSYKDDLPFRVSVSAHSPKILQNALLPPSPLELDKRQLFPFRYEFLLERCSQFFRNGHPAVWYNQDHPPPLRRDRHSQRHPLKARRDSCFWHLLTVFQLESCSVQLLLEGWDLRPLDLPWGRRKWHRQSVLMMMAGMRLLMWHLGWRCKSLVF